MARKPQPISEYDTSTIWSMGVMIPILQTELQKIFEKRGPLNADEKRLISELIYIWLPSFYDFVIAEYQNRKNMSPERMEKMIEETEDGND